MILSVFFHGVQNLNVGLFSNLLAAFNIFYIFCRYISDVTPSFC